MDLLDPSTVLVLLKFVDDAETNRGWRTTRRSSWATRRAVFEVVASYPGGAWLAGADVADFVNASAGHCGVLLEELADARMIYRDEAAGARPGWCLANPAWRQWRNVVWRLDRREIALRLGAHTDAVDVGPLNRFVARDAWLRARLRPGVARVIERATDAQHHPDPDPSDHEEAPEPMSTAARDYMRSRATNRGLYVVTPASRATNGRSPQKGCTSSRAANSSPPQSTPAGAGEQEEVMQSARLVALRAAIYGRAKPVNGARFLAPPMVARLAALDARHGPDSVDDAIARVPAGELGVPYLVDEIETVLAAPPAPPPKPAPPRPPSDWDKPGEWQAPPPGWRDMRPETDTPGCETGPIQLTGEGTA